MKLGAAMTGIVLAVGSSAALAQNNASQWDFESGDLAATFGAGNLNYWDSPNGGTPGQAAMDTSFGTTSGFGIGLINGVDAHVMRVLPYFGTEGLLVHHGAPANGGGVYTNQYTLVFDVYVDSDTFFNGSGWFPFHNTNATNVNDADAYIQFGVGIGTIGEYSGTFNPDTWHRVAFAFDLADAGGPLLNKYIDGVNVGSQILNEGVDGRWSLYCTNDPDADVEDIFYLFTEPEGLYTSQAYLNSIYFVDRALTDAEIAAFGPADADGIAGEPGPMCPCDFNASGQLNSADFFDFLTAFFGALPSADYNHDGSVNSADFFDFLTCFFTIPEGCS